MLHQDLRYTPLSQYDVDEGEFLYPDHPTDLDKTPSPLVVVQLAETPKTVTYTIHRWEWLTVGFLWVLSAIFLTLWISSANTGECTYVMNYFPAQEAVEYIDLVKYKGSLHFTTPWRGDESGNPSPEIDAAWRRISTNIKPIRITEEQLHKMGMLATPTTVKIPDEEGGGYLASLEVTHHLQCLDMLRKATYREYYESFDPTFRVGDATLMSQLDTCVEVLRQALMCYPDLNMVTYYWVHGRKDAFPDGNTIHRCKNFDKLLDWNALEAVDVPRISRFRKGTV